jgi:acetyltransferase-like isoleucine patch superfamily enzyme
MTRLVKLCWYSLLGILIRQLPHPRLASPVLRMAGATVGKNVRIHRLSLMNHELGLANLHIESDVYLGPECLVDVAGSVRIGARSCISARCKILSHSDPNSSHGNVNARRFPPSRRGVVIGGDVWLGVGTTVLEASVIGDRCVVGAGAVVRGELAADGLYAGVPARRIRELGSIE